MKSQTMAIGVELATQVSKAYALTTALVRYGVSCMSERRSSIGPQDLLIQKLL